MRIAALYKIEDGIRGHDPEHRRAVRQHLSRPLVDEFFTWLTAQAVRISRKTDLGKAMAYILKRQDGFRLFLDDGRVDIDSNLVENAIRSPAMNRRNALFAGHDEGGRNWARFASLIASCKMNGVEPYAYLRDLFISHCKWPSRQRHRRPYAMGLCTTAKLLIMSTSGTPRRAH